MIFALADRYFDMQSEHQICIRYSSVDLLLILLQISLIRILKYNLVATFIQHVETKDASFKQLPFTNGSNS